MLVLRSALSTGSSHYLLLPLFPIGQGLPPGKPDPPHFPSSPLCPTPGQLLFFFFFFLVLEYRALCLVPATQDQRVPCLRTRCPGASGLISEVKQTHYYGMEPSSVSGSPGTLGTELGRGESGWGGAGNRRAGSKGKIAANVSRWTPPQGESWGSWGGERPRQPHARWKEGKMVTEASNEGMREKTVTEKSQDQSPWRWHPEDQEGLGMCHSPPHSSK